MQQIKEVVYGLLGVDVGEQKGLAGEHGRVGGWRVGMSKLLPRRILILSSHDKRNVVHALTWLITG
jgi:hypothetical protein